MSGVGLPLVWARECLPTLWKTAGLGEWWQSLKNLPGSQVYSLMGDRDLRLSACKPSCGSVTDYDTEELSLGLLGLCTPLPCQTLRTRAIGVTVAWDAHRSIDSFWANSRQSLPRELGASRLLQIFWRMDSGILKA